MAAFAMSLALGAKESALAYGRQPLLSDLPAVSCDTFGIEALKLALKASGGQFVMSFPYAGETIVVVVANGTLAAMIFRNNCAVVPSIVIDDNPP